MSRPPRPGHWPYDGPDDDYPPPPPPHGPHRPLHGAPPPPKHVPPPPQHHLHFVPFLVPDVTEVAPLVGEDWGEVLVRVLEHAPAEHAALAMLLLRMNAALGDQLRRIERRLADLEHEVARIEPDQATTPGLEPGATPQPPDGAEHPGGAEPGDAAP